MHYRVRDGLSWCVCGDQIVFLDLASDRYFRLRAADDQAFQQWARSGGADGYRYARLIETGVIVPCGDQDIPPDMTRIAAPSVDLGEQGVQRAHVIDIARALVAQRKAASAVRRGRLMAIVSEIRAGTRAVTASVRDADLVTGRIAAAFASMPLSFRKAGQCLPRALAAHALSRREGVAPTLVFGVRLQPFAAHCWVQSGPNIIVGDLEQARMFVPILAVP